MSFQPAGVRRPEKKSRPALPRVVRTATRVGSSVRMRGANGWRETRRRQWFGASRGALCPQPRPLARDVERQRTPRDDRCRRHFAIWRATEASPRTAIRGRIPFARHSHARVSFPWGHHPRSRTLPRSSPPRASQVSNSVPERAVGTPKSARVAANQEATNPSRSSFVLHVRTTDV